MTRPMRSRTSARRAPSASTSARGGVASPETGERTSLLAVTRSDPFAMNRHGAMSETGKSAGPSMSSSRQTDCGDFGIHISRDGTWWYQGSPIGRMALVKLFASVLRRAEDGTYQLVTPVERGRITVEDAPFIAVELTVDGEGRDQS